MPESSENLDDLLMGEVSEGISESDEKFSERVLQAQQKIVQVKKDEFKSRNFDHHLSKILGGLSSELLDIVIFLIDEEIPSLTILAILSLLDDQAGKICLQEFEKHIAQKADFSSIELPQALEEKLSYWWTFVFAADHVSRTVMLKSLRLDEIFVRRFSHSLGLILQEYFRKKAIKDFDKKLLKKILQKYQIQLFGE
ncbi:hypothetical protein KAI58_04050 [Candidatus Gracilibacteria bacterium]|nr:hypothetical protein [Candidatus Gracilibacteria bacterium]